MKIDVVFYVFLFSLVCLGLYISLDTRNKIVTVDKQTEEMCKWYAEQGHYEEVEFSTSKQRAEWLGRDYIDSYDWYDSCINHFKYPVAR